MANYEFILCEKPKPYAPFAPLKKIGTLNGAKSRNFTIVRNRAGSFNFSLRTNDPMAYEILDQVDLNDVRGTVRKCVRIRRNKVDLWSGPIWSISGSLSGGSMQIGCVGWLEQLQHRILWSTLDYSNSGFGTPSDQVAFGLLNAVNAQDTAHPLLIRPGSVTGLMQNRNRFYVLGQNLGQAVQELSDIEAGYDYIVDPVTRELNLYSWDSYNVNTKILLGYNWGPSNLKEFNWQESADKTCNAMVLISLGAPVGPVTDIASQDQYDLFEEYNTLTGANQTLLEPYGVAELAVRSRPLVTYTVQPKIGSSPRLFDDFQIGDALYMSARKDAFKLKKQLIRVFGAEVNLDDQGNETVSNLMLAPQG